MREKFMSSGCHKGTVPAPKAQGIKDLQARRSTNNLQPGSRNRCRQNYERLIAARAGASSTISRNGTQERSRQNSWDGEGEYDEEFDIIDAEVTDLDDGLSKQKTDANWFQRVHMAESEVAQPQATSEGAENNGSAVPSRQTESNLGNESSIEENLETDTSIQRTSEDLAKEAQEQPAFAVMPMEGCRVLVKAEPDGRLDLRMVYFEDTELEIFSEPEIIGELPQGPLYFAPSEWKEEFTGDTLMEKDPWQKVWKIYLVAVANPDPDQIRLDIETVYCLDAKTKTLKKEPVVWMTDERNLQNVTLRIRPEGCMIEENSEMVSEFDLAEESIEQRERDRVKAAEDKSGWGKYGPLDTSEDSSVMTQQEQEGIDTPRDPIDALNDDDREYDETFEDTPDVDLGY